MKNIHIAGIIFFAGLMAGAATPAKAANTIDFTYHCIDGGDNKETYTFINGEDDRGEFINHADEKYYHIGTYVNGGSLFYSNSVHAFIIVKWMNEKVSIITHSGDGTPLICNSPK